MTDSTGIDHRPLVKDMLSKTYNFMVKHGFDVANPTQVYRAEVQTLGYHPSTAYCEKFVREIKYIKHVAENQPITTVTYTRRLFSDTESTWVDIGGVETEELKSYDKQKVDFFVAEWEYKKKTNGTYVIKSIETTNEKLLNINLDLPN